MGCGAVCCAPDASWRIWRDGPGWCKQSRGGSQQVSHSHNAHNGACSSTAEPWFIWCFFPFCLRNCRKIYWRKKNSDLTYVFRKRAKKQVIMFREIHLNGLRVAHSHWRIICGHWETDRKRSVTACSSHWQYVCVCSPQILERKHRHWSVIFPSSLRESGMLLFLKKQNTLCNLDRRTPLANHGFNWAGWYVTVNITCNSHNSRAGPYRAVNETFPHSSTLYHPQTSWCAPLR